MPSSAFLALSLLRLSFFSLRTNALTRELFVLCRAGFVHACAQATISKSSQSL
jgi:hypothetical protein